jgi:hypothetical protein
MRIEELLTEVTDRPYRYMLAKRTDAGNQYIFMTDAGTKMVVALSTVPLPYGVTRLEIGFGEQTPEGLALAPTGKGDAFRILATVAAITREFLAKTKLDVSQLIFKGKAAEPSRIKLYDRIARSLHKFLPGFTAGGEGSEGPHKVYYFDRVDRRSERAPPVLSDITESAVSGQDMAEIFRNMHWDTEGDNPEMQEFILGHDWTIKTLPPDQLPSEEELWDQDDAFDRIIEIDPGQVRAYAAAIKRGAQLDPIIMGPGKTVIDGNHRAQAAKVTGTAIRAYVPVEKASERRRTAISEGRGHPVICVDVQPAYSGMMDGAESPVFPEIIEFVAVKQTGPVLMFVNAEDQGLTGDSISGIKQYWEDTVRDLRGELDEIKMIDLSPDTFPINHVKSLLPNASPTAHRIDGLRLHEVQSGKVHGLILADVDGTPAAFAGFIERNGGKVWQAANAKVYGSHAGKALVAKIYELVKETYGKSIQSDLEQTIDARRLWTKTIPAIGLKPMIYDTDTGYIIDPKNSSIDVYDQTQPYRYCWIIERDDRYSDRDLLREGQLQILMPYRGSWYDGGISDDDRRLFNEAMSTLIDWSRFTIVDKGYGYFRAWMDAGVDPATIIRVIRALYQSKVSDSRELFGGEDSDQYEPGLRQLIGPEFEDWMLSDPIIVNWTSVAQLKRFNGAYIVGGGRDECLREVELLMNAFNIKYRRIDSLVYG